MTLSWTEVRLGRRTDHPKATRNPTEPGLNPSTFPRFLLLPPNDLVIARSTRSQKNLEHHEPSSGNRFESNSHRPHDSRKVRRILWRRQGPSRNSSKKVRFTLFLSTFLPALCCAAAALFRSHCGSCRQGFEKGSCGFSHVRPFSR